MLDQRTITARRIVIRRVNAITASQRVTLDLPTPRAAPNQAGL